MPTHWESSKRPLFIKTIWRDGQHHVILNKTDERVETRKKITPRLSSKSARLVKSASTTSGSTKGDNLNVSSVKLLGDNTFGDKPRRPSLRRCNTSIARLPENPQKLKYPRGERLEQKPPKKFPNLSIKSSSIDLNESKDHITMEKSFPFWSGFNFFDNYNESLSDRVMIWLDLATQNGIFNKVIRVEPTTPQENTTTPFQRKIQSAVKRRISSGGLHANRTFDPSYFQIEGVSQKSFSPPASTSTLSSTLNNNRAEETTKRASCHVEDEYLLSSEVEESFILENISSSDLKKVNLAKRQLHIFIPRLQKRISECDSVLSSNLSNYSANNYN